MMQAIETKFLGPTNFRGARVVASAGPGRRLILDWSHEKNVGDTLAAEALARKLGWDGTWIGGGSPSGRGNVYVRLPSRGSFGIADAVKYQDGFEVEKKVEANEPGR